MRHPIYRVTSFEQTGPFALRIQFDDGSSQIIDFEPILEGELYSPLRDPAEFARVKIDRRFIRWFGPLEPTSIRQSYMIGRSTRQHLELQHNAGVMQWPSPEKS